MSLGCAKTMIGTVSFTIGRQKHLYHFGQSTLPLCGKYSTTLSPFRYHFGCSCYRFETYSVDRGTIVGLLFRSNRIVDRSAFRVRRRTILPLRARIAVGTCSRPRLRGRIASVSFRVLHRQPIRVHNDDTASQCRHL